MNASVSAQSHQGTNNTADNRVKRLTGLLLGLALLVVVSLASLLVEARSISVSVALDALFALTAARPNISSSATTACRAPCSVCSMVPPSACLAR